MYSIVLHTIFNEFFFLIINNYLLYLSIYFRFTRLASHLLSQRCFYPLYPPNLDQNLDLEHLETHGTLGVAPHLVITPSDLQYFVRDLPESSTFVNPGRITKVSF